MRSLARFVLILAALAPALPGRVASAASPAFESDVVRPLALAADGSRLFAVNTPDARLEILRVTDDGLVPEASVPVGLEPVAVAVRTPAEVWVVNHLSDSVSVVDVASVPPRVTRTLWVGDEPRDVVFAGVDGARAFVTTAHRGQNSPVDPALFSGGVGRADVWVFDATAPQPGGGAPLTILSLFGDTPRALAATPDGATVYAAVYRSGNQTTTVGFGSICPGDESEPCEVDGVPMPGGLPSPRVNAFGEIQPDVGMLVRFDPATGAWRDPIDRDWRNAIRLTLPDLDVFAIDALATPPVSTASWAHVGTILFNLAVNPVSGRVYVSNTEARNERRFAGLGVFAGTSVRGHLHEARVTILDPAGDVLPRHLNTHIDYDVVPSPPGIAERSLAQPMGMAVSADGATLYLAAFGSDAVAVLDTAAVEDGTLVPDAAAHIAVSGGGPTGLVLDEARGRLYVATRFDDGISILDTATRAEVGHLRLYNPEAPALVAGRRFFYDARRTSSNGEASCAACHVFGDVDGLAWDLGDPDLPVLANPNPTRIGVDDFVGFRPMKGPMTTQTMRGIATQGPMHWRGDRSGALAGGDAFDERAALGQFNEAFVGLLGLAEPLPDDQLAQLVDFGLSITQPPNPHRALDGTLTPLQIEGETRFHEPDACIMCHRIDPANGFFGTDGHMAPTDGGIQFFLKIPPLHSLYQKVGLFEMRPPFNEDGDTGPVGPQVRGFGFLHDGSQGLPPSADVPLLAFVFAFAGPLAPAVGQQVSLAGASDAAAAERADLLVARAAASECDLVVHGPEGGDMHGWLRTADGRFQIDHAAAAPVTEAELRAGATASSPRVLTCTPLGSGLRMALDRDQDGHLDGDERLAGTDPTDAASFPCTDAVGGARLRARPVRQGGARFTVRALLTAAAPLDPPATGLGAVVRDAGGRTLLAPVVAGGAGWSATGRGWKFSGTGGVTRVTMRRTPTGIVVTMKGTTGALALAPADLPPHLTLHAGGACGSVTLGACKLGRAGDRLSCRE